MPEQSRDFIVIHINGQRHQISGQKCFLMLADYLRYEKALVGTKIVCAEGDCGACTVLCLKEGHDHFYPINSCIIMVAQLDGSQILTVEALKKDQELSSVQKSMAKNHASQCGFCTPGFAMAISGMMEKCSKVCEQKVKNCLTGNLCRCTGYQPIIDSVLDIKDYGPTLKDRYLVKEAKSKESVHIVENDLEFFAPTYLKEAVSFRKEKNATIIAGSSDVGVWINKGKFQKKPLLSLHLIKELYQIENADQRIKVGALATFTELRTLIKKQIPELASFLNIFASPQIKNVATLVGNIANGSPIGDSLPFMMVADGKIHALGEKGERIIPMSELYKGYKSLSLLPDEIITHASFSIPKKSQNLKLFKVSQRKDLDISTINAAFLSELTNDKIHELKIAFGGVYQSVLRLKKIEDFLIGQELSTEKIESAVSMLTSEIAPLSDLRASAAYRLKVCQNLFRRFLLEHSC